jgi:hypothetical protein
MAINPEFFCIFFLYTVFILTTITSLVFCLYKAHIFTEKSKKLIIIINYCNTLLNMIGKHTRMFMIAERENISSSN